MARAKKVEAVEVVEVTVVVELLMLNEKAQALAASAEARQVGTTLQAPTKGLGLAWRAAGYMAPNTRAYALAAIKAAYPTGCTVAQAVGALQAAKTAGLNLGSGTPNSYVKAFVANGYLA